MPRYIKMMRPTNRGVRCHFDAKMKEKTDRKDTPQEGGNGTRRACGGGNTNIDHQLMGLIGWKALKVWAVSGVESSFELDLAKLYKPQKALRARADTGRALQTRRQLRRPSV